MFTIIATVIACLAIWCMAALGSLLLFTPNTTGDAFVAGNRIAGAILISAATISLILL